MLVRYLYYVSDPSLAIRLLWGGVFRSPSQYFWAGPFFGAQGLLPLAHTHELMLSDWVLEMDVGGIGLGWWPRCPFETCLLDHAKLEKLQLTASEALGLHLLVRLLCLSCFLANQLCLGLVGWGHPGAF